MDGKLAFIHLGSTLRIEVDERIEQPKELAVCCPRLVLDHDACHASLRIALDGALHVHRVPIARVSVTNAANAVQGPADLESRVQHLLRVHSGTAFAH